MYCNSCGKDDLLEITIEKHETWYYCYNCKRSWGDYAPYIPLEEIIQELKDQGFPKDAERIKNGKRASEHGE